MFYFFLHHLYSGMVLHRRGGFFGLFVWVGEVKGIIFSEKESDPKYGSGFCLGWQELCGSMLVDTDLDMSRRRLLGTYPD